MSKKAYLWFKKWLGTFSIALFMRVGLFYAQTLVTYLSNAKVSKV